MKELMKKHLGLSRPRSGIAMHHQSTLLVPLPLLLLSVLLPEDMMNQKVYEGKKMG